ncbi:MAG: ATP synthase F1 subunit delta [Pirellulaceae bacterium]
MTQPDVTHDTVFDTGQQHLGKVYAKGLLGAADKAGVTETVLEELRSLVGDVLSKLPKFAAALRSPRLSHEEKLTLLDRAFGGKMNPLLLNFLKVVSRHGRLDCLGAIEHEARQLYNEARGRIEVRVRTAEPVDQELLASITQRLSEALKSELDVTNDVDPELLGGVVVRVGDTVYDGSVANRLQRLRAATVAKTEQEMRHALARFTSE